jgi:apolipoprotein N-acyltransferase
MTDPIPTPSRARRLLPWAAATLSGVLLALCFAPWEVAGLVWVACAPLLWALWQSPKPCPPLRAALLGGTTGLVFYSTTFHWLSALAPLFEAPFLVGLPPLLGGYLALYPALWAVLVSRPPEHSEPRPGRSLQHVLYAFRAAGAWVALEWLRGWLFGGFGWNALGVALHNNLALAQIADLFGALGLSFLAVYANVILCLVVRAFRPSIRALPEFRVEIMSVLLLIGASVSYGIRCVVRQESSSRIRLRVISLQPNISQTQKFNPDEEHTVLDTLHRMTGVASMLPPAPDLVLWPEAAIPRGIFAEQNLKQFAFEQMARSGAPLLLGSLEPGLVASGARDTGWYNSALLLTDNPPSLQSAQKRHLVPFGEFLPFRDWLPGFLQDLVPGDIEPGSAVRLLHLSKNDVRLGALICFEDSLSRETLDLARAGAQVLVNITNDAWFGTTCAAAQHFANAHLRAIETRLPLIRCANSGVTCAVDAIGRVEQRLAPFTEGVDTFVVHAAELPRLTVYARFGDLWVAFCGLNALALAVGLRRARRQIPG